MTNLKPTWKFEFGYIKATKHSLKIEIWQQQKWLVVGTHTRDSKSFIQVSLLMIFKIVHAKIRTLFSIFWQINEFRVCDQTRLERERGKVAKQRKNLGIYYYFIHRFSVRFTGSNPRTGNRTGNTGFLKNKPNQTG